MTVIRPNSISGINSITANGGDVNLFRADGTAADVTVNNITSGIITGTHYGSGANLTSLPAGQLTGTVADARLSTVSSSKLSGALPALDGSALTGVGASFGNSSVNTSGIITATAFVPTAQGSLSHRNLIYNGAMMVAQRGTSSTSSGYHTVDRFNVQFGGTDEAMTVEQANVASGTTPYTLGFLKCLKVTNGNQTSGAGGGDWLEIYQYLEDQDICNSGWNFKSATSYLTISFWVKSSVSQKFAGFFYTNTAGAGNSYTYSYQIDNGSGGNLSADTWTKITHTIPGNSSLTFNNDNTKGLAVGIFPFDGTDYTTPGHTEETWQQWSSSNKLKDMDSTWWTTNDATFELTGVQLEVGPVATPFEHLPHSENKRRCYRYCQRGRHISSCLVGTPGTYYFSRGYINLFTPMRATISGTLKAATWNSNRYFKYMTWSSETNVTAAPATVTFSSGNISDASSDIVSLQLHISISSGSSNSPLPANGPGSNNVYPIEYFDVLLEAEL